MDEINKRLARWKYALDRSQDELAAVEEEREQLQSEEKPEHGEKAEPGKKPEPGKKTDPNKKPGQKLEAGKKTDSNKKPGQKLDAGKKTDPNKKPGKKLEARKMPEPKKKIELEKKPWKKPEPERKYVKKPEPERKIGKKPEPERKIGKKPEPGKTFANKVEKKPEKKPGKEPEAEKKLRKKPEPGKKSAKKPEPEKKYEAKPEPELEKVSKPKKEPKPELEEPEPGKESEELELEPEKISKESSSSEETSSEESSLEEDEDEYKIIIDEKEEDANEYGYEIYPFIEGFIEDGEFTAESFAEDEAVEEEEEAEEEEEKKLIPTRFTRNIIMIRHGQYNNDATSESGRVLTALGEEQVIMTGHYLKKLLSGDGFSIHRLPKVLQDELVRKGVIRYEDLKRDVEDEEGSEDEDIEDTEGAEKASADVKKVSVGRESVLEDIKKTSEGMKKVSDDAKASLEGMQDVQRASEDTKDKKMASKDVGAIKKTSKNTKHVKKALKDRERASEDTQNVKRAPKGMKSVSVGITKKVSECMKNMERHIEDLGRALEDITKDLEDTQATKMAPEGIKKAPEYIRRAVMGPEYATENASEDEEEKRRKMVSELLKNIYEDMKNAGKIAIRVRRCEKDIKNMEGKNDMNDMKIVLELIIKQVELQELRKDKKRHLENARIALGEAAALHGLERYSEALEDIKAIEKAVEDTKEMKTFQYRKITEKASEGEENAKEMKTFQYSKGTEKASEGEQNVSNFVAGMVEVFEKAIRLENNMLPFIVVDLEKVFDQVADMEQSSEDVESYKRIKMVAELLKYVEKHIQNARLIKMYIRLFEEDIKDIKDENDMNDMNDTEIVLEHIIRKVELKELRKDKEGHWENAKAALQGIKRYSEVLKEMKTASDAKQVATASEGMEDLSKAPEDIKILDDPVVFSRIYHSTSDVAVQTAKLLKSSIENIPVLLYELLQIHREPVPDDTSEFLEEGLLPIPLEACELLNEGVPILPDPPLPSFELDPEVCAMQKKQLREAFKKFFYEPSSEATSNSYEILVSHATTIRYFICRVLKINPAAWVRFSLPHCSITWVKIFDDSTVKIRCIGDTGHLLPNKISE